MEDAMRRTCDFCGDLFNEFDMMSYNTGRRTVWLCWDCYKNSQREANLSDRHRQHRLYKINQSKKRNG